jgi:ABC-type sugar transport system ATPase subunit
VALHKVNLNIQPGEIHGIIGKNGAGKTTLMGIISGIISPTEGDLFLGGEHFKSLSRKRAKRKGISIVTQEPQVIPDFTVAENLFTPDFIRSWGGRIHWKKIYAKAEEIISRANLKISPRAKASDLTISEQQLLLVLKACYLENPHILILDEVTASLSQKDQEFLYEIMKAQKKSGKTLLFISHRLGEILEVCDRVTVLRDGKTVSTRKCSDLDEENLSRSIVGEDCETGCETFDRRIEFPEGPPGEEILFVDGLSRNGIFQEITFHLREGEILGLAGLRGSGRTEILKALGGIDPPDEGTIKIGNETKRIATPSEAFESGIVYLPEDRDKEGLVEILSVKKNLTLFSLRGLTSKMLIAAKKEEEVTKSLVNFFSIQTPSSEQEARYLSGGNRQKVVVGKVFAAHPKVFLLDEPTKGIDIAAKKKILSIIREELTKSAGVILTSPGLDDLLSVSDRILALFEGRIIREFAREEIREKEIYLAMQGVRKNNIYSSQL